MGLTYNNPASDIYVYGEGTPESPFSWGAVNYAFTSITTLDVVFDWSGTETGFIFFQFSGTNTVSGQIILNQGNTPGIIFDSSDSFDVSNNFSVEILETPSDQQIKFTIVLPINYQYASTSGSIWFVGETPPVQPYRLYIIDQPGLVSSGNLLSPQPSVGIKDQFGNVLTNFETDVQVSLVVLSGSASLTGTDAVSTTSGVATFTDLVITGNGLFYLHFESTIISLNPVDSNQLFFQPDPGNPNPPIPVKPKRSYVVGSVPTANDLEINEFAINVADRKGYMRDSNDIVHLLFDGYATGGGGSGGTVYSVGVSSQDLTVTNSPITTSGFIGLELNTQSITAGAYGDGSNVAEVTVNDKGIVTGIQNVAISYPVNSITAGTDISLTGTAPDYTINNTAPDQIVSLTSGTGVSVTGTYPDFTIDCTITQYTDSDTRLALSAGTGISYDNTTGVITNDAPDQIVSLTGGTDISVTGTYPNFTIDYTGTNTGVTSIIAGTGISVDVSTGDVTVTNTDPDQIVSLTAGTGINVTGTYPSFTIDSTITQYTDSDARLALSAGTGISYDNTTGVITNDAPDQTVSLTGGTDISVTGTYPNFTIDYTGTPGSGTVNSVGITTTSAALTISNSPITTSGDIGVNFSGKGSEYVTGDGGLKTFPTTIDQALNLVTEIYNSTGATLTKGTVVYINGGQGNLPTVTKAQANNDANSAQTYGIIQSDTSDQSNGYVVVSGRLIDIDTQSYSAGTQLYLSPTTAGAWTTTKPAAPNHLVYVGIVVRSHPTQGVVEVKIQNGYELDEIHDVSITSVAPNNILRYNSSTKLWENVAGTTSSISEGSNLYYTDARVRLALSAGTGITYDNSTGKITNSSPDQTVVLTAGTGISTIGTYPNFTINSTITQYTDSDARKSLSAGTGISYDNTTGIITNSSPDQTVKLTGGTGISTSGTYPNFTITNAAPDQTVALTAGTGIGVTGTYPSFTISSTITQYTDSDARKSLSAGTGITYDNTTGIITNADPDQVVSLTAGTSISISGTYPSFTITNDDPDQIVSLTGGTDISITGTYPSFTIDYIGTPGTGTVTSITAGSYLTGGTITTSGTIDVDATSFNTASKVVARDGSGNFSAGTITASLTGTASSATNLAGGGAGQVPYNTGSGATSFLAAGTSGQVLRSNGTSAPSWEVQGLFSSGRLTLESGVPVSTTDQTSKTTIYYTPYNGDKISLYDGTNWATYTFTERSLSLGTLTSARNYDVFLYNNAGTLTLELTAWTNDTTRATSLTMTNGVYLKTGVLTRRYLGTIRTTSTTTTEDSLSKRYVWNFNNKVLRSLYQIMYSSSHTYNGNAREWNNGTGITRVQFVTGIDGETFVANGYVAITSGGFACNAFFGLDSTTTQFGATTTDDRAAAFTRRSLTSVGQVNSGYHYLTMVQSTESAGTSTFLDVTGGGAMIC